MGQADKTLRARENEQQPLDAAGVVRSIENYIGVGSLLQAGWLLLGTQTSMCVCGWKFTVNAACVGGRKAGEIAESLSPNKGNVGKQQCELIGALSKLVIVFYLLHT
jgi:hypothetical protein